MSELLHCHAESSIFFWKTDFSLDKLSVLRKVRRGHWKSCHGVCLRVVKTSPSLATLLRFYVSHPCPPASWRFLSDPSQSAVRRSGIWTVPWIRLTTPWPQFLSGWHKNKWYVLWLSVVLGVLICPLEDSDRAFWGLRLEKHQHYNMCVRRICKSSWFCSHENNDSDWESKWIKEEKLNRVVDLKYSVNICWNAVDIWWSYCCSNFMSMQETDSGVAQQHRSRGFVIEQWLENGRITCFNVVGYCDCCVRTSCHSSKGWPFAPSGIQKKNQNDTGDHWPRFSPRSGVRKSCSFIERTMKLWQSW